MKKAFRLLFPALILLILSSCSSVPTANVILDNSSKSRFIDFYTENEYVYIECELNIYSDSDTEVTISALDEDDVKAGLLKSSELTGYTEGLDSTVFSLKSGENTVKVYFSGEYAGIPEISAREIPRFIKIESTK